MHVHKYLAPILPSFFVYFIQFVVMKFQNTFVLEVVTVVYGGYTMFAKNIQFPLISLQEVVKLDNNCEK